MQKVAQDSDGRENAQNGFAIPRTVFSPAPT